MHISEGVLEPKIIIPAWAITGVAVSWLLWRVKVMQVPKIAVCAAIFFVASFIHFPLFFGVSSVHLILSGLIGVFLGFDAFLAIFIGLLFQGLLFGFGGISTLGLNTIIIAFPAIFAQKIYKISKFQNLSYFLAGFLPIFFSSALLSLTLFINGKELATIALLAFFSNTPLMIIEGFITLFALKFLQKTKPEILP